MTMCCYRHGVRVSAGDSISLHAELQKALRSFVLGVGADEPRVTMFCFSVRASECSPEDSVSLQSCRRRFVRLSSVAERTSSLAPRIRPSAVARRPPRSAGRSYAIRSTVSRRADMRLFAVRGSSPSSFDQLYSVCASIQLPH